MICPGCSCLCDDVEIVNGKIRNACRRGEEIISKFKENRAKAMVQGREVDVDSAIEAAAEILKDAKKPVIYGLDTSVVEAQELAIDLAEKLEAYIDDNSSFCLGEFVEAILKKEVPTTTLDRVRDEAYVIIYWGANPFHSLPRHMSRYSYYPRGNKRPRGYDEDRYLVVVDVRRSETSMLAKKNAKFIKVESDIELVDSFTKVLEGKVAKYAGDAGVILNEMKKADTNVVFGGLGLKYGLGNAENFQKFKEMVRRINEVTNLYFIPAGFHGNMRGFNETLFKRVGRVNRYGFNGDTGKSFTDLVRDGEADAALIIGTDPVSSLPFEISSKLRKMRIAVVDPRMSLTAKLAEAVIPSAFSGIEVSGTMVRSDGVRFKLEAVEEKEISDIYILKKLLTLI